VSASANSPFGTAAGRRLVERAQPAPHPWRMKALLSLLVVALVVGFVVVPIRLTTDSSGQRFRGQEDITAALNRAFSEYWASGEAGFTPGLARLVDYWSRYHLAKVVFAGALVAVLGLLARRLWRDLPGSIGGRPRRGLTGSKGGRPGRGLAGVVGLGLVGPATLGATVVLMANIQGAVVPFASLLSMLPVGQHSGPMATALGQLRRQVAVLPTGRVDPVTALIVEDFARYHLVLAVVAMIIVAVCSWLSVVCWRRAPRATLRPGVGPSSLHWTHTDSRRARHVARAAAVGCALTALVMLVLVAANLSTATQPAPAFLAFLGGAP